MSYLWWEEALEMFTDYTDMKWSVWQDYFAPESEKENWGCMAEAIWAERNGLA